MSASSARQIRISGTEGGAWLYASFEPSILEACSPAAQATADPIDTSSAPTWSASRTVNSGGRVRLTTSFSVLDSEGPEPGADGGSAVLSVTPSAGSATAPAVSSPSSHSATCTAQSV